jgi:hypothetical protein
VQSLLARWLAVRPRSTKLENIVGAVHVALAALHDDPNAARCTIRVGGASIEACASSAGIRRIAQNLLGGPDELAAPRPLTFAEEATWSLIVTTALEDLGVAAQVWPIATAAQPTIGLDVRFGDIPVAVAIAVPPDFALRVPPSAPRPSWADRVSVGATIVVGRCALHRDDLSRLALRSLVTIERTLELEILGGTLGLAAPPYAVVAEVATGYVRREMTLPDDAHVELTVALGTTQLSLRQVFELSVGQIVSLGRPLAGPFELRAAGRMVGKGELVDVDGELAVRIVSVGDKE